MTACTTLLHPAPSHSRPHPPTQKLGGSAPGENKRKLRRGKVDLCRSVDVQETAPTWRTGYAIVYRKERNKESESKWKWKGKWNENGHENGYGNKH